MKGALPAFATLLARVLLALMFLAGSYEKIVGFDGTVAYITKHGLPLPEAAAVSSMILELGAGIALILGFKARWAALALVAFVLVLNYTFHAFWTLPAGQQGLQMILFLKNLAVVGGLLLIAAYGPGAWSVDARRG